MHRRALLGLLVLLGAFVAAVPATAREATPRIVGGAPTGVAEWPWIAYVGVEYAPGNAWACGGSVVAPRMVLTAAHCVLESGRVIRPALVRGIVGRGDLRTQEGTEFAVRRIAVHPDYERNRGFDGGPYDVAMLETTTDLPVPAIGVATAAEAPYYAPGAIGRVAGWGLTRAAGAPSDVLQQVDLPIVSDADCARLDQITVLEASKMICAGRPEGGVDACQGDSGGPLVVLAGAQTPDPADDRWLLAGVVSWGYECAAPNRPGLYARSATFAAWVSSLIAGDPTVWGRALDRRPPRVRQRVAEGVAGSRIRLTYRITGEEGRTRESITIRRAQAGTVLRRLATRLAVNPNGRDAYVTWRAPRGFAPGAYVWCITSKDESGNRSPLACRRLTVRAPA